MQLKFRQVSPAIKKKYGADFCKPQEEEKIDGKVHEVTLQRDLFGRLLALSFDTSLDLEKVLCFPITPMLLSLCHIDGSLNKTAKSVLIQQVEDMEQPPSQIDLVIVDGLFFSILLKKCHVVLEACQRRY
ncbi:hypothetical protein JTB14_011345 [Gonioctena quinquepunctata]|nr:hypothetical protein JTB14_011345 [Gonioctena quinquepunctata]